MPSELELAGRILLAIVLGGAIGVERETSDKAAGMRTHVSVALGSALFAMVSAYGFATFGDRLRADSSYQVDVTRVASNIVTGVGFLGGGAIVKHGASVRGLTTAASLWVSAAIGLAAGLGLYFLSVVTTVCLLVALIGLLRPRRWIESNYSRNMLAVTVRLVPGAKPDEVVLFLQTVPGTSLRTLAVEPGEQGIVIDAEIECRPGQRPTATITTLVNRDDVLGVDVA